ncbi:MAG: glycosyltransferase family 1 protein [Candidatus Abyssobacteria bacterium SURF_5]|uniref:Glycosyltransferase family 1 protein n=1 Tax=Abyssobacteria bacterium (strain SURF_5) TaxID=2093360 RepID=A0A3A4P7X2_ABYX5|nr:MAG: glycosyltransferase family 1 protein [Candidatus Abyssubacteria bacterium SURF_5]
MRGRNWKIAVFHNIASGGSKRSIYEFCSRLRKRGAEIDVYSFEESQEFLPLSKVANNVFTFRFNLWFPLGEQALLFSPLALVELARLRAATKRVARQIDAGGYDLVLIHNCKYTQCPFLARFLKTPSIYYCHELYRFINEPHPRYSGIREKMRAFLLALLSPYHGILRMLERNNMRSAGLILTNSCFTQKTIREKYGLDSEVLYQGVSGNGSRDEVATRRNYVLCVGQLNRWKAQDFLIQALAEIEAGKRPELVIIFNKVSGSYQSYVRKLADRLGVKVTFAGNVSEEQLHRYYEEAKAFVYAPIREPFGFTPLEAALRKIPVVAVGEGGVRETVVDGVTGRLAPREPKAFAAVVSEFLDPSDAANLMVEKAYRTVKEKWDWERTIDEFEKIVDDFLSAKPAGAAEME